MSLFPNGHQSGMFIHADPASVARCLVSWGNEEIVGRRTKAERRSMSLKEAWLFLDQRIFTPDRGFVIPIGKGWSGFFDNHSREFVAGAELFVLCQRLKVDTCFLSYDHSTETERCGSGQFNYNRYGHGTVLERQVMLLKEGGWSFQQGGEALPFEDLSAYAKPKKRERLTVEMLKGYGTALGLPFWDKTAYGTEVFLLRWGGAGAGADEGSILKKFLSLGARRLRGIK